jgi:hypothetical protein
MRSAVAFAALFTAFGSRAQELNEVAFAYLQRRGVPCLDVTRVDRPVRDYDMVATCEDGRQWALFFIEGEVAFIQPDTGEPYRWRREMYLAHPELYGAPAALRQPPCLALY